MDENQPVAIVTGAGSGIGRATTVALLAAGYRVALAGRRDAPLRETVTQAAVAESWTADTASRTLVVPTDVTDPASVQALFTQVSDTWGRVDVLFNNAGIFGVGGSFSEVAADDWKAVIDTNLTGSFLCAREAFRVMQRQSPQGGRIINNGSVSSQVPRPGAVAYTASKHAINGLTKAIALEGRPFSIACGQIDIGNARTELTDGVLGHGALQPDGSMIAEPMMDVRAAAEMVVSMADLPLSANVLSVTVMATNMPLVGRG